MVEDNLSLGEELKKWVKDLICDIGPRWAGSPAEARAAERIRGEFEKVCDESYIDSFKAYPRYFENSPHIILLSHRIIWGLQIGQQVKRLMIDNPHLEDQTQVPHVK